jgi:hypothetical protein
VSEFRIDRLLNILPRFLLLRRFVSIDGEVKSVILQEKWLEKGIVYPRLLNSYLMCDQINNGISLSQCSKKWRRNATWAIARLGEPRRETDVCPYFRHAFCGPLNLIYIKNAEAMCKALRDERI